MSNRTRIVLCDDHPIVLAGFRNLIKEDPQFAMVGEASNGMAALKLICETLPDIAIIDISMPELNGIMLARRLADEAPTVRLLMMTLHEDRAYLKQAMDAGVRGYVLKRSAAENLVAAIRAVVVGGLYVDPALVSRIFENRKVRFDRPDEQIHPELSSREVDVLKMTAIGFTTKEIALRIGVGPKSIETYKARGLEKLGLKTRVELVRYASTKGRLADI